MNITKRQPVSVGEMITEEFLVPMELTQGQLAEAMGVSRKTVNETMHQPPCHYYRHSTDTCQSIW